MGMWASKCGKGLPCQRLADSFVIIGFFKMAPCSLLDEVMMTDNDSELEQVGESSGIESNNMKELALEAQKGICLEAFNDLGLGDNLHVSKDSIQRHIKGSYQAFKPLTDTMKILLNITLNCGSLFKTESELWLQKISFQLTGKPCIRTIYQCEIQQNIP